MTANPSPGAALLPDPPRLVSLSVDSRVHGPMATPLDSFSGSGQIGAVVPAATGSFEEFFEAEHARLFGALAVMSGNRAEAEEVMQDAFLRVWERWSRVSAMDSPTGFLYRTAMNIYRKRLRRARVAMRQAANLQPEGDGLGAVETRDEVARLLRGLTVREREAIVLTAYLGYSAEEAGKLLGIAANTVRVLTSRARASLRRTSEERR